MRNADRIAHLSKALSIVALVAVGVVVLGFVLTFILPDGPSAISKALLLERDASIRLDLANLTAVAAVFCMPLAAIVYALWSMFRLFRSFSEGDVFSAGSSRQLAAIGRSVVAFVPLQTAATAIGSFMVTRHAAPEAQRLIVAVDVSDLLVIVLGGLLWVIGWVIAEATQIADENRSII